MASNNVPVLLEAFRDEGLRFEPEVLAAAKAAASALAGRDDPRRETDARVRARVLAAFVHEGIAHSDLEGTLGYGYDDAAREGYERLLARVLGAERALARLSFVSGTHAIVTALAACAPPGSAILSATGRPYDTLRNAISGAPRSLVARGVAYDEIQLDKENGIDFGALADALEKKPAVVFVQRSRGYASRRALSSHECGAVARLVHERLPDALVLVDNCYGELVEASEPTHHGADLVMGSLIKNLGGSLAPGGGYVAGRADAVARVADYHYAPGLGAAVGSSLGFGRQFVQGLFNAPAVVAETLAGLDFVAELFSQLGFAVDPQPGAVRRDIVQAIGLGDPGRLVAFARGLQRAMPLDARFAPVPGAVPGYAAAVIMSSGAFVSGATIELSCDAPLREPYEVYVQGGTLREHTVLGGLYAAEAVLKESKRARSEKAPPMGNASA